MKIHRITPEEKAFIVNAYQKELIPMRTIARELKVSRQAIFKTLSKAGIPTSKKLAALISIPCHVCNQPVIKKRCAVRKYKHLFCSSLCYNTWLKHGNGNPLVIHRNSSRIARLTVSSLFNLQPNHIVHHEDRNQFNNDPLNLKVFNSQADHLRYHRDLPAPILWELTTKRITRPKPNPITTSKNIVAPK